jgi:hypothetical protein
MKFSLYWMVWSAEIPHLTHLQQGDSFLLLFLSHYPTGVQETNFGRWDDPLKMEGGGSFKMMVPAYHATQWHIPQYSNLHSHHCENLKSYSESS